MKKVTSVVIAGLGGQGVLKASDILSDVAFRAGLAVKKSEIHGMSQRGGSATSDVRFGREVFSPMVPEGEADFLVVIAPDQVPVNAAALRQGGPTPYAATLLEQTLAHETGHRLGRTHRERVASAVAFDKEAIKSSLQLGQFMQQPDKLNVLFVEEFVYALTQAAGFATNQIRADERVLRGASGAGSQEAYKGPAQPPFWPFKVTTRQTQVLDLVRILSQDGTIMCWTPELDKQQPTDWHFALDDLDALCLRANGCKAGN